MRLSIFSPCSSRTFNSVSDGFANHSFLAHFVGAVNAETTVASQFFKELPNEGSFAHSSFGAENVNPMHQGEILVEIPKAGRDVSGFGRVCDYQQRL